MSKEKNKEDIDKFFCKETILINGKVKCKSQCDDCIGVENSEYTDTNEHIGSCC